MATTRANWGDWRHAAVVVSVGLVLTVAAAWITRSSLRAAEV